MGQHSLEGSAASSVPQEPTESNDYLEKAPGALCVECPLRSEGFVPSAGPEQASLVIVGEGPGFNEVRNGVPFTGQSGKLLDTVLQHHGIKRSEVRMTNVVLCRPPENRAPTKKEVACCAERLRRELLHAGPNTILALGNTAASAVMGKSVKITSFRAGPPKRTESYPGSRIVPSIHPAACLRAPDMFPSLVSDVGKVVSEEANSAVADRDSIHWEPPQYRAFDSPTHASSALRELLSKYDGQPIVLDIETAYEKDTSFDHPDRAELLCVGIGYAKGRVAIIGNPALRDRGVQALLSRLLRTQRLVAHNGKFDLAGLRGHLNEKVGKLHFDTMLASYCLDERSGTHGLKYLAGEELGLPDYSEEIKKYKSWADIPTDKLYKYNAYDVACTYELYGLFSDRLAKQGLVAWNDFLTRASNALLEVEQRGVSVDVDYLDKLDSDYSDRLDKIERELHPWVDNPRSPMQVKKALAELGYEVDSTDVEHLEDVLLHSTGACSQFVSLMLKYRKAHKTHATYIQGLRKRLYKGRVYPTFLLHGSVTGRLSCRNPNLQNITRGSELRSLFVPSPGNVFVQADYCVAPETKILTAELDWKRADELTLGQELVGFDEQIGLGSGYNAGVLKSSYVERSKVIQRPCYKVVTDRGTTVVSAEHKFVGKLSKKRARKWIRADELQPGMLLSFYMEPWNKPEEYEAGYLAGFMDGEGWISDGTFGFAQLKGDTLDYVLKLLDHFGFEPKKRENCSVNPCENYWLTGNQQAIRFLGMFKPVRLGAKTRGLWEGRRTWHSRSKPATVLSVEFLGEREVVALATSTKTFVSDGFLSHNSQAELRALACLARDEYLRNAFQQSRDVHGEMAERIFGRGYTKEQRTQAKITVFSSTYGISPQALAIDLKITTEEAAHFLKSWYAMIPDVIRWREEVRQKVLHDSEDLVSPPYNRHRRFWLITDENKKDVVNEASAFFPQAIASDICLTSLCKLAEKGLDVRLTVHDSILAECPVGEAKGTAEFMREQMESTSAEIFDDYVPFKVDISIGKSWGEL